MKKIMLIAMPLLLILLTGCSPELYTRYELKDPIQKLDESMLLAQLGKPVRVIDTTPIGGPITYSYLYASAGGCVGTYSINAATRKVSEYRCIK